MCPNKKNYNFAKFILREINQLCNKENLFNFLKSKRTNHTKYLYEIELLWAPICPTCVP